MGYTFRVHFLFYVPFAPLSCMWKHRQNSLCFGRLFRTPTTNDIPGWFAIITPLGFWPKIIAEFINLKRSYYSQKKKKVLDATPSGLLRLVFRKKKKRTWPLQVSYTCHFPVLIFFLKWFLMLLLGSINIHRICVILIYCNKEAKNYTLMLKTE